MAPRHTKSQKATPKLTKQQRANMREMQAAQAESRVRYDEACSQLKIGNYHKSLYGFQRALELQPNDKYALVARSKCHLMLGLAKEALEDADAALAQDKHFIKGIFQKAEALYHLGDFEHSLMFYHRGQRVRPEQAGFRLGVQKAQEAIENAIGSCSEKLALMYAKGVENVKPLEKSEGNSNLNIAVAENTNAVESRAASAHSQARVATGKSTPSSSKSRACSSTANKQPKKRQLLSQLSMDRQYLENLLLHPDIKTPTQDSVSHISSHAEEGVAFLKRRQEFWRQQCPN